MRYLIPKDLFDQDWFMDLSPKHKLLWFYINSRCDAAGVWVINFRHPSVALGSRITTADFEKFGPQVKQLGNGKLLIKSFIASQAGKLQKGNGFHDHISKLISVHGLSINDLEICPMDRVSLPYQYPTDTPREGEGEGAKKQGECEGKTDSEPSSVVNDARCALSYLNEQAGRQYRDVAIHLDFIISRLKEPGVDLAGVKQMINRQVKLWKGDEKMDKYLRPSTLFNATKFAGYYDDREQPVNGQKISANGHAKPDPAKAIHYLEVEIKNHPAKCFPALATPEQLHELKRKEIEYERLVRQAAPA